MNILIDMNLSPLWIGVFQSAGHCATHWSSIGPADASDSEIMEWARSHQCVVFTHDLDFGSILASTDHASPSVIQLRTPDPVPGACGSLVVAALNQCAVELGAGALVTINVEKTRVRILPIGSI